MQQQNSFQAFRRKVLQDRRQNIAENKIRRLPSKYSFNFEKWLRISTTNPDRDERGVSETQYKYVKRLISDENRLHNKHFSSFNLVTTFCLFLFQLLWRSSPSSDMIDFKSFIDSQIYFFKYSCYVLFGSAFMWLTLLIAIVTGRFRDGKNFLWETWSINENQN